MLGSLSIPARVSAVIVVAIIVVATFAPFLAPYAPNEAVQDAILEAPSGDHPFGTDEEGMDLLSAVIHGSRAAVAVGFGTVAVSLTIGLLLGVPSGYFGGLVDDLVMRLTEIVLSFPGILLAILLIFVTRDPSVMTVILALSLTGWAGYARLVRGLVLSVREKGFVTAARGLGAPHRRILVRHVLPNVAGPLSVQATFGVAGAILAESTLSFIGLGPQDVVSWGALLQQGAVVFISSPYVGIFSGLAITITVMAVGIVGDGLRDKLDPKAGVSSTWV